MNPIPVVPLVNRELIDCTEEEVLPSDGVKGEEVDSVVDAFEAGEGE
jgi:hypothetical protein